MESDVDPGLGPSLSPLSGKTLKGKARQKGSKRAKLKGPTSLFSVLSSDFPTKPPENLFSWSWTELERGFDC